MRTVYQERRALGSRVQLALVLDDDADADGLFRDLWLETLYFEKRCSRFLPDSELSQLNRAAGAKQHISTELHDVLSAAVRMATLSGGLYNPFVLPALQRAGYVGSLVSEHVDDPVDNFSDRRLVPSDRLQLGDDWAMIPYGTALDLGGCGKGYIGDKLVGLVQAAQNLHGFWFSIGGDTILGGHDETGTPWTVYLQPDPAGGERIGEVAAPNDGRPFAVATSTTRYRRGGEGNAAWHHIIDPRTGVPADSGLTLATACGPSLLMADVLASCMIIAGPEAASGLSRRFDATATVWQSSPSDPPVTSGEAISIYN